MVNEVVSALLTKLPLSSKIFTIHFSQSLAFLQERRKEKANKSKIILYDTSNYFKSKQKKREIKNLSLTILR